MREKALIIAIDGPSGAGKSTLSKALAARLAYLHIDTGAMYRSVALQARRQQVDCTDERALDQLCADLKIGFAPGDNGQRVLLNGQDVTTRIRTPEISRLTPGVAASPAVRRAMLAQQRRLGEGGGVVLEGRDIGTVVFPDADVKFFLQATAEERGRRRYQELCQQGTRVDLQQTIDDVIARDRADADREQAPLRQAADAVVIDSTSLTIEQVLQRMLEVIDGKREERE